MTENEWKQKFVIGEQAESVSFDPRKCRSGHCIVIEGKTGAGMAYELCEMSVSPGDKVIFEQLNYLALKDEDS